MSDLDEAMAALSKWQNEGDTGRWADVTFHPGYGQVIGGCWLGDGPDALAASRKVYVHRATAEADRPAALAGAITEAIAKWERGEFDEF